MHSAEKCSKNRKKLVKQANVTRNLKTKVNYRTLLQTAHTKLKSVKSSKCLP